MGKIDQLPRIFKTPSGDIEVVYKGRVEHFKRTLIETKADIDKQNGECCYDYEDIYGKGWNAHHEVRMLKANGFREIHPRGE